jgi:cell division protein FtsB
VLEILIALKSIELKAVNATDKELLESQARYRFGLIKKGERYYQINPR